MVFMEEWKDIPGWEGRYQISNLGRVKSLSRMVRNRNGYRHLEESIKQHSFTGQRRYPSVNLPGGTRSIHRLLATLWIPNPNHYPEVLHKDDDVNNYDLQNLYWGTQSENLTDCVSNDNHHYSKRTQCKNGHEYTEGNVYYRKDGGRRCLTCESLRKKGIQNVNGKSDQAAQ